ncbi:vesicle transport through interaction with t-SNAREs homolog 1A isoform X7 [Bubalus kerabau]|uniref:vesicle transport through interaction with t-SNAREs homolog 1A isoform X7 n=1 Tax=Bubalus carabanensis TaxID=3119969 RepID=UPI00244E794C|nr:vesicle transport through interaction with t-SNAREs homolog 1A isoform X7 [Bubalus carabanensis]
MSSDFEGYEQDFAVLTAEITNKIARVPRLPPDEKKQMVANVEKQLEEAKELLEQMDLEVREIPPQSRGMYSNRMRSYKQEMGKLETDFKRSRIAYSDEVRNELLGDDGNSSENQRAHLLDNTERLERSSRRLEAGYQIAVETAYTLNGSASLEPGILFISLKTDLHHLPALLLPSSTQALRSAPLLSVNTSSHPALMSHLVSDLCTTGCCSSASLPAMKVVHPSPRALKVPHPGLVTGHM